MYIAILKNARAVALAEETCRQQGLTVYVRAVPETISSECGLCLEIAEIDIKKLKEALPQATVYEI
ncbi:MAG: putative Se/S carrier-like protein [Mucinivorans sp.]